MEKDVRGHGLYQYGAQHTLDERVRALEARVEALEAWREEIDPEAPEAAACTHSCHNCGPETWNYCPACGEEL